MGKNRNSPAGQHGHCAKCYSRHCHAPVEISVSCVVINCRLHCGATFHLCKEEEHKLLCPNAKVPCLNAEYGCPFSMQRHRRARHLEFCPASVVSCSQEWNRWPVAETDTAFYRNAMAGPRADGQMSLDLSMALRDQELLFRSIKMKNVFPEMIEVVEEPSDLLDVAAGGVGPPDGGCSSSDQSEVTENGCNGVEIAELSQEERDALAKNKDVEGIVNYRSWEGMFRKEMQGCSQTVKNLSEQEGRKVENASTNGHQVAGESAESQADGARGADLSRTGLAPWEDGVLERLRREVNVAEYNRYLAQNGAMLINFGQLDACTPRERDFVYGNLEPIEVQTVRTFNVPTSYTAKRCHLKDPSNKPRKVHQSVDTSDLEMAFEDLSRRDEVNATLLCSLERELKGHVISERAVTDALYVDQGTQTYDFLSAPFKHDASLADVIADRPKGLHVQIQTESVTRRHNRTSSAFSHICGRVYRRDEYRSHFRNVHADIQSCLNGWFEQRCPLAYLGCTFSQRRFHPTGQQATITYNQELGSFTLRPQTLCQHGRTVTAEQQRPGRDLDPLSRLPFEVLQHVASFLDSFTLCQLSKVSQLMREVCATLLEERGMVSLKWEKNTCPQGGSSWGCRKKVWAFSDLFSSVDQWCFNDVPSMTEHLKVCPFYQRDEQRSEPVALASMGEVRERAEGQSLVDMFQGKQPPGTRGGGSSSLTG